ncbi:MAG: hypothetical protein EXS08_00135 [Planctomycetes bacterium]|nr:hypothetical protein [Planctomycetota bacterium]
MLVGVGWLVVRGPLECSRPVSGLALALAGLGWLGVLACAPRVRDSLALLLVVASGALALRSLGLASELRLSDDLERYVWEGALLAEGVDPYAHAPDAPALESFQRRWPELHARVGHREVPAAYPPLAQALNAGVVCLAGGAQEPQAARFALRLFYGLCDLGVCVPLAWLLRRRGLPLAGVAVWAWNPLVVLEFAGAGHLDALAILCTLAALAALANRGPEARGGRALAWLATGTALKLLPLAVVPFALRAVRGRGRAALAFFAAGLVCVLPFVLLSGELPRVGGLSAYAFRWESFSMLYRWIEPLFARTQLYDESWSDPRRLARGLVFGVWLALGVWAWVRGYEPARAACWMVAGFLVLTPTLHPWYLTWIVPFLALRPSLAWSALVAAAPFLYWPLERWRAQGTWAEPAWLWPAVALPFWGLLVCDAWRRRGAR